MGQIKIVRCTQQIEPMEFDLDVKIECVNAQSRALSKSPT